jgi:intraflagellar transport protein 56
MGDIPRAKHEYEAILERDKKGAPNEVFTYLACCLFMLGMYKQAEEVALKGNSKNKDIEPIFLKRFREF